MRYASAFLPLELPLCPLLRFFFPMLWDESEKQGTGDSTVTSRYYVRHIAGSASEEGGLLKQILLRALCLLREVHCVSDDISWQSP